VAPAGGPRRKAEKRELEASHMHELLDLQAGIPEFLEDMTAPVQQQRHASAAPIKTGRCARTLSSVCSSSSSTTTTTTTRSRQQQQQQQRPEQAS
jgi:hypothetical protein